MSPPDSRALAAPIDRDEAADAAALEALHKEAAEEIMAAAAAQEAAEKATQEATAATRLKPTCNVMLHEYRQFEPSELEVVRNIKDVYFLAWATLHELDGTPSEQTHFNSRELGLAALRLEESLLWAEKAFHV